MGLPLILFLGGAMVMVWLLLWSSQRRRLLEPESDTPPPLSAGQGAAAQVLPSGHGADSETDAVLMANARGQLIYANDIARAWFGLNLSELDLEMMARIAQPSEALLELFGGETAASFRVGERWLEGESLRVPAGSEMRTVVILRLAGQRPAESSAASTDGSAPAAGGRDLSRALILANAISENINASLGVDQVLQTLITVLRKTINADAAEITLWDEKTHTLQTRGWSGDVAYVLALSEAGGMYRENEGISGWIARYRKPLLVADRRAADTIRPKLADNALYASFIGVPLTLGNRLLGTAELASVTPGYFQALDLSVLSTVAVAMATAIYNAELYAEQARRLDDMASLQQTAFTAERGAARGAGADREAGLNVTPDAGSADGDFEAERVAIYSAITAQIADLLDAEMCGVLLYDERRQMLSASVPFHGLSTYIARTYAILLTPNSFARELWERQEHWLSNDLADDALTEAMGMELLVNAAGAVNTVIMPLFAGGERIGMLQVANKRAAGGFAPRDIQLLRLLAAQAAVIVQDARMTQQAEQRDTEISGVQAIMQVFGSFRHESEFFAESTRRIAEQMGVTLCGILLYDDEARSLVGQPPFFGVSDEIVAMYRIPVEPGSVIEDLWRNEESWYTNNAVNDRVAVMAGLADLASALGVGKTLMAALSSGGRRLGIVQVASKISGDDFTERDARLLQIFAAQIASMIENSRLFRETQRRAEESESLRRVAEYAAAILTTDDSFLPTLAEIARLMDSPGVFVNMLDRTTGSLVTDQRYLYGIPLDAPIIQDSYAPGFEYSVALSRRPFLSNDVLHDKRVLPSYRDIAQQLDIRSSLVVPLVVGETALGELGIMNREGDYVQADITSLSLIGLQIAGALDRIRLYAQSDQNLRRRLIELDAISRVSSELTQTLDLDRILDMIRLEAVRATEAEGNTIALLEQSESWPESGKPILSRRLGEQSPALGLADIEQRALLNGTLIVYDYAAATDAPAGVSPTSDMQPQMRGVRSALAAPILYAGAPIGVIHLYHRQPSRFDEDDAKFMEALASKASLSYGNLLRYNENSERAEGLRRRVEQLNQIFELSQMLQTNIDPVTMLEAIAYSVQRSSGYQAVVMLLTNPATDQLERVAQAGIPLDQFETNRHRTISVEAVQRLFSGDKFALSESRFFPIERMGEWYSADVDALSSSLGLGSEAITTLTPREWRPGDLLIVPMMSANGDLLAAMSLDKPEDNARPDRNMTEILEIFAHQAAATLENNLLFNASLRSAEQEARLNEVMEAIASTLDPIQIVSSIARGALRLLPFTRMTLVFIDSESSQVELLNVQVQADNSFQIERDQRGALTGTALLWAIEAGSDHLYHLDPEDAASGIAFPDLATLAEQGERTSLIIPLISGGLPLGAMHFGSDLVDAFGFEEYRGLLRRIASIAAVAFVNANLFERAQARTQRLSLLNNVSLSLAQSLDTENILEIALREVMELIGAETGTAYLIERDGETAQAIVEYPRGDFPPTDLLDMRARPTLTRILRDAKPIIIEDVAALPASDPLRVELVGRKLSAYLLVPMTIAGQANGFIEGCIAQGGASFGLTPERLDLILIIANQTAVAVLNASLLEQTLIRTRELETLLEAAQATSLTQELSEVFGSVAHMIGHALEMDECTVMLYDDVQGDLRVEYALRMDGDDAHLQQGDIIPIERFPARELALTRGQVILVRANDPKASPQEVVDMQAVGEFGRMLVPLIVGEQPIGMLLIGSESPERTLNLRNARMAQALASQAATSIENARLTTETAAQVEQSMIINELSRAISSTMDITQMIAIVRDNVPALTNADEIYLALYDDTEENIVFPLAVRNGEPFDILPRKLGRDEASFVIRNRRPLSLGGDNPSVDEVRRNLGIKTGEEVGGEPITRYLGVPLIAGDLVVGLLAVRDYTQTRPFGLNDQRILTTIGTQLGAAIQNANLFERVSNFADELNRRVEERTEELQQERDRLDALYRITAELGQTLDMGSVLERALGRVAKTIRAEEGIVLLFDPLNERLYVRAVMKNDKFMQTGEMPLPTVILGNKRKTKTLELPAITPEKLQQEAERLGTTPDLALLTHPAQMIADHLVSMRRDVRRIPSARPGTASLNTSRTLIVDDLLQMEGWDTASEWHSALAVTLETNDDVQGAMVFLARPTHIFGESQAKLVSAAAAQVSAAINNADLYNLIRDQAERMTMLLRAEREEVEKNSAIVEGIADGVLLADDEGDIILFNSAAERILGLPRDLVMDQSLAHISSTLGNAAPWVRPLVSWTDAQQRAETEARALSGGTVRKLTEELIIDRLDIGRTVVNLHASPVYTGEQRLGTVAVFRDITRDVEVDRMKSEFISNVSHELRTPMTSIKGYADLLLMNTQILSDEQQRFLNTIKHNADRLSELVNDLLNISRLDTGEPITLERTDVGEVITGSVRDLGADEAIANKHLQVTVQVAPDLPMIMADRMKLAQIVNNVIDNAFKYTYPEGVVDISAESQPQQERILITVRDNGIGIAEDFQSRVWDRFERDDEHALVLDVAGTGLGLSIVRHLVEMHDGDIWFDSEVGKGTTFFIALPVEGPIETEIEVRHTSDPKRIPASIRRTPTEMTGD